MNEIVTKLNEALDTYRNRQGLCTDRALADHLRVSSKTISLWRNGKSLPKGAIAMIEVFSNGEQAHGECACKETNL
jgi:DNA-binding XRE family transcriptional regulator